MKRVLFTLVFASLLLSFGLANAMSIYPEVPASAMWDDGGTMTIKANQDFTLDIVINNGEAGDLDKAGASMPFMFYGTGDVAAVNHVDAGATLPAGSDASDGSVELLNGYQEGGFWSIGNFVFFFGWDGALPDTMNHSGSGFPGFVAGHTGTDTPSGLERVRFYFNIPLGDLSESGTFCIDTCQIPDQVPAGKLNWLFDVPLPTWAPTCWPVAIQPDPLPTFTNCDAYVDNPIQFDESMSFDFNAVDGVPETPGGISFAMVSGPGDIDPVTGVYSFDPTCAQVGSHDVVVGVTDGAHAGQFTECAFTVTVENTAPVIADPAKDTISVGTESAAIVTFTSSDANTGDTEDWTSTEGVITYNGTTATLTYTAGTTPGFYDVTVTVEDCAGATDTYTVTFNVISAVPFDIVIEKVHDQHQGTHAYVDVFKGNGSEDMLGFDFLIGYDPSALSFVGAMKGEIFNQLGEYGWEYFTYRYNYNGNCGNGCPSGLLRVVGMAESNDGPNHPDELNIPNYDPCLEEDTDGILFTLDFLVSADFNLQAQFVGISFYWMDCGDNTIAYNPSEVDDPNVVWTAVADEVFAYGGTDEAIYCEEYRLMVPPASMDPVLFPTYYGADAVLDEGCLDNAGTYPDGSPKPAPVPFIRFFNGGIDIIPVSELDDRGDVNLNGIPNEIADAVVFTNYFIVGLNAFTVNIDGQTAATEINGDGIALTVADLVYLVRVIVGDALPLPAMKVNPGLVAEVIDANDAIIVNAELGAAQFVLEGNATVSLGSGAAGMEMISAVRDDKTYVLVYSFEKGMSASGEILVTNSNLISMDAANYNGFAYTTKIIPATYGLSNYPNPFNPTTTIELSLPVASNYAIGIFNVVGQKVGEFTGYSEAGTVSVNWDASNQASGIYFYKAEAGKYSVTKKMVLIK